MSLTFNIIYNSGNSRWSNICWSAEQNKFVAIADNGTNRALTSSDGTNWTEVTGVPVAGWHSICWSKEADLFVAVANSGATGAARVMTSPDGTNWTERSNPHPTNQWFDVCWSPQRNLFVAIAEWSTDNNNRVITSSDGINWDTQPAPPLENWRGVCWSPERSLFVAVAGPFGIVNATKRVMTSSDGFNWYSQTSPSGSWIRVCWSSLRGLFVAVADSGTERIMTSPDGSNWTPRSAPNAEFRGVCWSQEAGIFLGVCWGGPNRVWTSTHGTTWTPETETNTWYAPCWSRELNMFAIVSWGRRVATAGSPVTAPSVPRDIRATVSNARVDLRWDAPSSDGGSAITGYNVTRSPINGSLSINSGTRTATASGLNNGTSYTFTVTATNGAGFTSSDSVTATPYTNPSVPRDIRAIASSARVDLSWNAPTTIGGSSITSYNVTRTNAGAPTPVTVAVNPGTTRTATASGLTNGTLYTFTITATNAQGGISPSGSVTATPATNPSVPRDIRATASSARVDLSWNEPISNGGVSITGYSVTRTNTGAPTPVTVAVNSGTTRTATASGLTNGTLYTFTITATNGANFTSSGQVTETPFTVPNTPRNFTAVAGVRLIDLSWSPPLFNGGRDILSYLIQRSNNGINAWGSDISTNASINTFRVTGLGNNTRYYFRIYAINIAGPNVDPSLADSTTFNFPGQPRDLSAIPGNGLVTLTWTPPSSNGGSPITSYSITNNPSGGLVSSITDISAIVSGLINGISYSFTVIARNAVGDSSGAISNTVTPNTIPSAPTISATSDIGLIDLSWSEPNNNGSNILEYRVERSSDSIDWFAYISTNASTRFWKVLGATNGVIAYFRVYAINSAGDGLLSNEVSGIRIGVPNAPINVTATSRNAEATINWSPPTNDGGRPITSYSVTSYSVTSSSGSFQVMTANGSTRTATISGLTNDISYTFRVIATNEVGDSTASDESNTVTPNGPPLTNKKIAISNDGKVVALSSSYHSDISKGRIYVYELSYNQAPSTWNRLGLSSEILVGLSNDDQFGWDLALSSDGRVVAGSSIASDESGINCGQVRLFELSSNTNSWIQKGFAINGQTLAGESGYSISLAGNGNRIAIGSWKDNSNGTNAGAVRVYDFSSSVNDWRQQGQTLLGDPGSYEGYSTALSLDGLTLATGCLNVNNANNIINAGKVKTFTWSGTTWENKGIIQGADISYLYFGRALKLSANGNTIVVGAPGYNSGQVYRYQGGTTWTQLGQTLVGISDGDEFGANVAISNDGTIVSIGSDNNSNNRGHVRVFAYANNYWNQVSNVLSGKTATSKAGIHALSGDGTTLIQSNNTYNTVYGINKTLAVNAPMTTISGNLIVMGNISVNSLVISRTIANYRDISNHNYRSDGYSYKMFDSDLSSAIMKEYYSDVISTRNLKVQITGNGAITNRTNSYKAFSDSRLKENIVTSGPKLADLLKVRVVDYTMKGSTNTKYIGVLAQELEDLFPNLVTELEPSPKDIEDGRTIKYKAVNYSSFDAILIKSLQEQNAMLKNITKRIEAIEAIEALEEK
jgi:fibronectin type 3 domain-containing protein